MLPQRVADIPSSTLTSSLESSRLFTLLQAFEARVVTLEAVFYRLLTNYTPFPFEVTVIVVVFGYIAIRQIALWYISNVPTEHAYVYWKLHDLIDSAYYSPFLPEHHMCTALLVYMTQKLWRDRPLTAAELRNKSFMVNLLSLFSNPSEGEKYCDSEESTFPFREKEALMLPVKLPIYPFWIPTHQDGVEVCTWMSTLREKNCEPVARRSVFLRVRKRDSPGSGAAADAALRHFVEDALSFYFANGYSDQENYTLRMYRTTAANEKVLVQSVPLPLGPTLDTVFFPQRSHVKALLAHFLEKKGRYAIPGFPHKLGFLLYGPRGTGKRSFVRALAYHTRRHIVRIPLSRFTRSDQLFSIFYFHSVLTDSAEEWALLNSKKVIFLIEDVDTSDDLVRTRGSEHVVRVRRSRGLTTRSSQRAAENGGDAKTVDAAVLALQNGSPQVKALDTVEVATRKVARVLPPTSALKAVGWERLLRCQENKIDKLNLSSLLNVLDGAVEDPERIVVMIADHPEQLDPALLRPGRLTTHLRFDYIELDDLLRLCGLFFGAEYSEASSTLTTTGEANHHRQRDGYSNGRMVTSPATPPQQVHDGLLETTERHRAKPQSPIARVLKEKTNDAGLLQRQGLGLSASMTDAKIKERVLRQLSLKQAAQVCSCISTLEEEASSQAPQARENTAYNFLITPAHVHHLCMHAANLNGFLDALSAYIRNGSGCDTCDRGDAN
ncbi:AAA domain (dynein-related subfamily) [Leishmania shawi]|uniref:AAA domain (Dynein-related subfamily) n=1 Tax=Leishmania shawi TaxID=5680 RepID=A0AAW3B7P2_9TRYP